MKRKNILIFCIGCVAACVVLIFVVSNTFFRKGERAQADLFEGRFKQVSDEAQASRQQPDELISQLPGPFENERYTVVSVNGWDSVALKGSRSYSRPRVYQHPIIANAENKPLEEGDIIFFDQGVDLWVVERNPRMVTIVSE